jgi:hypothetical protein
MVILTVGMTLNYLILCLVPYILCFGSYAVQSLKKGKPVIWKLLSPKEYFKGL